MRQKGYNNLINNSSDELVFNNSLVMPKESGKGIKLDSTTPVFGWADLIGTIQIRGTGTPLVWSLYSGNIYQYSFKTASGALDCFNEFHIPHDYVEGTDMFTHLHWSTNVTATGNIKIYYEISYAKGYGQADAIFNTPIIVTNVTAGGAAFKHFISEVQFTGVGGVIASAINVSITSGQNTLTSAASLFTTADVGRTVRITGAGAAGADLNTTISAYSSATQVTVANNAGTTITTLPNFKYRVIDSTLLQTDGLILVRCWRDANDAYDTLDQLPFAHFLDCHYQSTGIPTRNKNYPFYT
jgi:hypothetical protein